MECFMKEVTLMTTRVLMSRVQRDDNNEIWWKNGLTNDFIFHKLKISEYVSH